MCVLLLLLKFSPCRTPLATPIVTMSARQDLRRSLLKRFVKRETVYLNVILDAAFAYQKYSARRLICYCCCCCYWWWWWWCDCLLQLHLSRDTLLTWANSSACDWRLRKIYGFVMKPSLRRGSITRCRPFVRLSVCPYICLSVCQYGFVPQE